MFNFDRGQINLEEIVSRPSSFEDTIDIYKACHVAQGFNYVSSIDFLSYDIEEKSYIKAPIDIVMDILFSQVAGLLRSISELIDIESLQSALDIEEFICDLADLSCLTLINYNKNPYPITFAIDIPETFNKVLLEEDRNICSIAMNEIELIISLVKAVVKTIHDEKAVDTFSDVISQWYPVILNSFLSTMSTKSLQKGIK